VAILSECGPVHSERTRQGSPEGQPGTATARRAGRAAEKVTPLPTPVNPDPLRVVSWFRLDILTLPVIQLSGARDADGMSA